MVGVPAQAQPISEAGPDAGTETIAADAPGVQGRERARTLYDAASRAYENGDYEAAIASLREAHAAYRSTLFVFNIAQAQRQLGDCSAARQSYLAFLEAEADPELRARAKVGLERLSDCRPKAPPLGAPDQLLAHSQAGSGSTPSEIAPDQPRSLRVWVGWTSAGVLAAATAVSGGLALSALSRLGDIEASKPADPAEVASAQQRARSLAITADVLAAAALATAGLSLYWTLKERRARRGRAGENAEGRGRLSVHLSSAEIGCSVRF